MVDTRRLDPTLEIGPRPPGPGRARAHHDACMRNYECSEQAGRLCRRWPTVKVRKLTVFTLSYLEETNFS